MGNALFYGDNLGYLRDLPSAHVDLIYLDPPFNSKTNYNLLFRDPVGSTVQAQTTAFSDTWSWGIPSAIAFDEVMTSGSPVAGLLKAFRSYLGESDMMAYLTMMCPRLIELHRVLKETGSLYLHCDPTASHYLKLLLDGIFGPSSFRNEIVWKRSHAHSDGKQGAKHFGRVTDSILFYARGPNSYFQTQYQPYDQSYIDRDYRRIDQHGRRFRLDNIQGPGGAAKGNPMYEVMGVTRHWRYSKARMEELIAAGRIVQTSPGAVPQYVRYLDEMPGVPLQNLWADMPGINNRSAEMLGYPTQKPLGLLKRIIGASSRPEDVVLDPFCGCGTTIDAAQAMGRRWLGIDITHHAIDVIEGRLRAKYTDLDYKVAGRPTDLEGARRLASHNEYEFQWWANWMLGVQNYREKKKGPDKGIDGIIYFHNPPHGVGQVVVSVKAGKNIAPKDVDSLAGVVQGSGSQCGVFVCLDPTDGMRARAAGQGIVRIGRAAYPRIQIVTAADLVEGRLPSLPRPIESDAFRQPLRPARASRAVKADPQLHLPLLIAGSGRAADLNTTDHLSGTVLGQLALAR